MRLFPFTRPSLGLSIGAEMLGLVEVRRGWRTPSLRRRVERTLPAGLLRLSASESNVADVSALAKEISALLNSQGAVTRPVPISLSLPDRCARVALLEFDTLPQKSGELDRLIRWRFQKDLNMPVTELRLAYQVFQPPSTHASAEGPIRILAVAVRANVIEPYERACELAGLIPMCVGLTSLQLFDLCRPAIEAALKTAEECFYLYVGEGSFAFLAIREGVPVFLRIKPLQNGSMTGNVLAHASVTDELLATVYFYMEREAVSGKAPALSRPLFWVNGDGTAPVLPDSLGVTVVPIGWSDLRITQASSIAPLIAGLPAFAGVIET